MFIFAQLLGTIALIILVISFQKNDKKDLLKYQVFSSLFFSLQYFCLNAYSGSLMNIMTLVRNLIFSRYNKKVPIIYLIIIIIAMITFSLIFYDGLISLLPAIAVILYSIAIWQDNLKKIRIIEVISCSLFIIYNIKVLAIVGIMTTCIELFSAGIAIYKFDINSHLNKNSKMIYEKLLKIKKDSDN